jgi:hypothetical protein
MNSTRAPYSTIPYLASEELGVVPVPDSGTKNGGSALVAARRQPTTTRDGCYLSAFVTKAYIRRTAMLRVARPQMAAFAKSWRRE